MEMRPPPCGKKFDNGPVYTYRSVGYAEHGPETRRQILRAALKRFANSGYAATSVQQIVDDAKVSKPALYYYFHDKAGLFQALVSEAHDERLQVVQRPRPAPDVRGQLVEILAVLFEYFHSNRELTRIAFATMFASPGEVPPECAIWIGASAISNSSVRS